MSASFCSPEGLSARGVPGGPPPSWSDVMKPSLWLLAALGGALPACRDTPTGVALLERTDSVQRQLSNGISRDQANAFFMGTFGWFRNPYVDRGDLTVRIGGEDRAYTGLVYERVMVRMNPADGYPCPLVRRTLVAWPKSWGPPWEFVTVTGADFTLPISRGDPGCEASSFHLPSRPIVTYLGPRSAHT